jgi:AcrR family transcriptional regulator
MVRPGRRPGKVDTRAEIVAAAGAAFAELGYEKASIRGIAKRAGVDAALVHHYFADKAALFVETRHLPIDPHDVQTQVSGGGRPFSGERLVERFLAQWESRTNVDDSHSFITFVQAVSASPQAADAMREFLNDRIPLHAGPAGDPDDIDDQRRRRSLITSQLLGLGFVRYVMRIEPIASADRRDVARWVGPNLDRYAAAELLPPDDANSPDDPDEAN